MQFNKLQIKNICKIIGGQPAPKGNSSFCSDGLPFVRMRDFGRYHLTNNLFDVDDCLSEDYLKKSKVKIVKKGSILLPRSGSVGLNHRAILGRDAVIVSHICALEVIDRKIVNNSYLYYYLQTIDMVSITKKTTGLDAITFEDLAKIIIPIPPISYQERTSAILDHADSIRRKNKQILEKYNELAQSVFYEMFRDDEINPKKWNKSELGTILNLKNAIKCGPFGSQLKIGEYVTEGIPVYGIDNVATGKFIQAKNKHVTNEKFADLKAFAIQPKDILMTRTGTVGRACLAPEKTLYAVLGPNLLWIRANAKVFSPEFLCFLFNHSISIKSQIGLNSPGATVAVYNTTNLKKLKVIVPPIEIQNHFTRIYKQIENQKELTQRGLEKSDELFQSLLQRAFKGEL